MASQESADTVAWEYVPGLLELVEEGLEPVDLASREFIAPQVRGSGLVGEQMTARERSQVENIWNWLRGFRRSATLCERQPIWVPLARIWSAPEGKAEFRYTVASERELRAEITVFSAGNLGGASKRKLSTEVKLMAAQTGVGYDTRAYLTVYEYTKASTGERLQRVDVDCSGEVGEFRSRNLDMTEGPFGGRTPTESELRSNGYVISRVERCVERSDAMDVTLKVEHVGTWKFEVASAIPGIALPFKLGATCQNAKSFETKFTLPGGRDYAFCAGHGEQPLAPLCVVLGRD